jgi:hypothetical protein
MADTGTSLIMLPDVDYFAIKERFVYDKECHTMQNTLVACTCTKESHAKTPDIKFDMDGETFVINRDMWYQRRGNTCVIKFMHAPGRKHWILGVNFFNNYYAVMNYETRQIGFAKSKVFAVTSQKFIDWALSGTFLMNLEFT